MFRNCKKVKTMEIYTFVSLILEGVQAWTLKTTLSAILSNDDLM